jgi:nucleoside-diphosphate-sugar epimerase
MQERGDNRSTARDHGPGAKPRPARGPLVLGATGKVGKAFRRLWAEGHWPAPHRPPLWQHRPGSVLAAPALVWDILHGPAPDREAAGPADGLIVLAGVTSGTAEELAANTAIACAAIDFAVQAGIGPVLLCSSAAVYGAARGPQPEAAACTPANAYGEAKLQMEQSVAARLRELGAKAPPVCCLRIANVAGSDQLFAAAAPGVDHANTHGSVTLDQFPDGTGPRRSYIGPRSLAQVMLALIARHHEGVGLPFLLNVAAPGTVAMADILNAAGAHWDWGPAPDTALPELALDTGRLAALAPPAATDAAALVAEARQAGWRPGWENAA